MDKIKSIGGYIVIVTCIIAVAHGLIHRQFFAPMEISLACIFGIALWVIGFLGEKAQKYLFSKSRKKSSAK